MNTIEENWNVMAMAYENFTENPDSYSYSIEWPCVQKMLPNIKGKRILDLGCGTGRFTFLLENEEPDVITGIDLSQQMLDIARDKAQRNHSNAIFQKVISIIWID
nr:class I SAM-dependent methyltransferase [uncultured Anaerosporobacter sp.]